MRALQREQRRERNAFGSHLERKRWRGGKRTQTKSWRKEWNHDHSLDVVHRQIFVVTLQRYRSNSSFSAPFPRMFFLSPLLHLHFMGLVFCGLMPLNWADVEEMTELKWVWFDQDFTGLHVFKVMMVVNPPACSVVQLQIWTFRFLRTGKRSGN